MGLDTYVRAVAVRWAWLVVAGLIGLVGAGLGSAVSPAEYTARTTLYVSAARVDGEAGAAYAARIRDEIVPSIARLAGPGIVADRVVDRLDLPFQGGELSERTAVEVTDETNLLALTVSDPDPAQAARVADAFADELAAQARLLLAGPSGPLLRASVVEPATAPRYPDGAGTVTTAAAGAAAGTGLAVVGAGLAHLCRPRIRGRRDVGDVTPAAVLAILPAAPDPARAEHLAALRVRLAATSDGTGGRRVLLFGASPGHGAVELADDLAAPAGARPPVTGDLPVLAAVTDLRRLRTQGTRGVVVVVDGRATTRDELVAATAAVRSSGARLLGVVLDGVLPSSAPWRARLRAGFRGDAAQWVEDRLPHHPTAGAVSATTRVVAALAVAALGFTRELPFALTTGLLVSAALLPVWAPVVRRYRGAALVGVLTGLGLGSGLLLAWLSAHDHDFARYEAATATFAVLTLFGGAGLVLWARTVLPLPALGVAYGLGALADGILAAPASLNAWKFELSFPITVIVVSLLAARKRPAVSAGLLLVLGLVNVVNDARSAFAFTVVAAMLVLWQALPGARPGRLGTKLVALGLLAVGGYWVLRELLLAGFLGSALQERTATQIAQTGSLLLGGRPEATATWALMQDTPLGFGLGTVPTAHDVLVAGQGISVTRIPTVEGYLENYLLAGRFELHSIVADLWSNLGPAGIALGVVVGVLIAVGLAVQLERGEASALGCYLAPLTLWSLAFGPLPTDLPAVTLALGLLLVPTASPAPPPSGATERPLAVPDAGPPPARVAP